VCLTLSIFFQGKHSPGVTESSGGKTGPGAFSQPSDYSQKLIAPGKKWEMVGGISENILASLNGLHFIFTFKTM